MNYDHAGNELAQLALELQESIQAPDASSPRAIADRARVDAAAELAMRAAELLLELEGEPLAPEVEALEAICLCGLDRGEHLCDSPYPSEDGRCPGYVQARLPDLMTDPAPAPRLEVM
jgi:hypothetical protein